MLSLGAFNPRSKSTSFLTGLGALFLKKKLGSVASSFSKKMLTMLNQERKVSEPKIGTCFLFFFYFHPKPKNWDGIIAINRCEAKDEKEKKTPRVSSLLQQTNKNKLDLDPAPALKIIVVHVNELKSFKSKSMIKN